jgi:hypothetical protein
MKNKFAKYSSFNEVLTGPKIISLVDQYDEVIVRTLNHDFNKEKKNNRDGDVKFHFQ